jgi:toluene monooxygenase system protein D
LDQVALEGVPQGIGTSELSSAAAGAKMKSTKETVMTTTTSAKAYVNNLVGPVMRAGELAQAIIEAAREDNPQKEVFVDDKRAYIRIHTEQEMILNQKTIENALGRPFRMNDLEVDLSSFAGQIESRDDSVRFYLTNRL